MIKVQHFVPGEDVVDEAALEQFQKQWATCLRPASMASIATTGEIRLFEIVGGEAAVEAQNEERAAIVLHKRPVARRGVQDARRDGGKA